MCKILFLQGVDFCFLNIEEFLMPHKVSMMIVSETPSSCIKRKIVDSFSAREAGDTSL